jgi:hypothetical protein
MRASFDSKWIRWILVVAILVTIKVIYDNTPVYYPEVDHYSWTLQLTYRLLVAFIIILVGSFLSEKLKIILGLAGVIWLTWKFIDWYVLSYRAFQMPNLGWEGKINKLGLVDATWGHILLLFITFVLILVAVAELYQVIRLIARPNIRQER